MASVNVATTATAILAESGNRSGFILYNNSDVTIYIAPSASVTATADANQGHPIAAGKELAIARTQAAPLSVNLAWYAIHAGVGNKALIVNPI